MDEIDNIAGAIAKMDEAASLDRAIAAIRKHELLTQRAYTPEVLAQRKALLEIAIVFITKMRDKAATTALAHYERYTKLNPSNDSQA